RDSAHPSIVGITDGLNGSVENHLVVAGCWRLPQQRERSTLRQVLPRTWSHLCKQTLIADVDARRDDVWCVVVVDGDEGRTVAELEHAALDVFETDRMGHRILRVARMISRLWRS